MQYVVGDAILEKLQSPLTYRRRFFDNSPNMVDLMIYAAELGGPCVRLLAVARILDALRASKSYSEIDLAGTLTVGLGDTHWELKQASEIRPQVLLLYAMITDRLDLKDIERWPEDIWDLGLVPGCVTHKPARVLPVLTESVLNRGAYMVPLNREGIFMGCKPDDLIKSLDSIAGPMIAKKTSAAGALSPQFGLPSIAQNVQIDGLALGLASREEMRESPSVAISHWARYSAPRE